MLPQVSKVMSPEGRKEFAARFGAWWEGVDYVAPEDGEGEATSPVSGDASEAPAAPPPKAAPAKAPAPKVPPAGEAAHRVAALEALWGEGRFEAGEPALDNEILDALFDGLAEGGSIGFIGADPALIRTCRARADRGLVVSEWRKGCAERVSGLIDGATLSVGEIDRPGGFEEGGLAGLVSVNAFAYGDHKVGLVSRAHHALSDSGRWIILDMTRHTAKSPTEAFASAWAEPQLTEPGEIEESLELAKFTVLRKVDVTDKLIAAARCRLAALSGQLDAAVSAGSDGRAGALFLQEMVWDLKSWRARVRALEGGALKASIWVVVKGEAVVAPTAAAPTAAAPEPAEDVGDDWGDLSDQVSDAADAADGGEEAADEMAELDQSAVDSLFD